MTNTGQVSRRKLPGLSHVSTRGSVGTSTPHFVSLSVRHACWWCGTRRVHSAQPPGGRLLPRAVLPLDLELEWGPSRPGAGVGPASPPCCPVTRLCPPRSHWGRGLLPQWASWGSLPPPTSCLEEASVGLRFHTLRAVCSLFAEVLWPVFWFSYVLESHKLKTGHFPDLTQVTCRFFFRVCHVAVLF